MTKIKHSVKHKMVTSMQRNYLGTIGENVTGQPFSKAVWQFHIKLNIQPPHHIATTLGHYLSKRNEK
jgi:hypothetical protein